MSQLVKGQYYTLRVIGVQNAADSFTKGGTGGTAYCHFITLIDDTGEVYHSQIVNDYETQNQCKVNDNVRVKIKTLTKDRYTLEDVSVVVTPSPPSSSTYAPDNSHNTSATGTKTVTTVTNPQLAGKASSIALHEAVAFYGSRPVPNESADPSPAIIKLAESFYKFLLSKEQP
jgi:hypothetical protein